MEQILLTALFAAATKQFNLPQGLLASLCYVESAHDTGAIHHDDGGTNSVGICQVKLSTAQWLGFKGTEKELMEPKTNIYYAAKYLKYNISRYKDHIKGVVAYNRGNALGLTSSKYSDKVINQWRNYGTTSTSNHRD